MKFGNFHDEGGAYFKSLELEDNSNSDNKVLFFAPGSAEPVLYEGASAHEYRGSLVVTVSCRRSEAEGVVGIHCFGYQRRGRPHDEEGGQDDVR